MAKKKVVKKSCKKPARATAATCNSVATFPSVWSVSYDCGDHESIAKTRRDNDSSVASTAHQFAAGCAHLLAEAGNSIEKERVRRLALEVLEDAAAKLSFRRPKAC